METYSRPTGGDAGFSRIIIGGWRRTCVLSSRARAAEDDELTRLSRKKKKEAYGITVPWNSQPMIPDRVSLFWCGLGISKFCRETHTPPNGGRLARAKRRWSKFTFPQ